MRRGALRAQREWKSRPRFLRGRLFHWLRANSLKFSLQLRTILVISAGAPSRMGGPQKPVPQLT